MKTNIVMLAFASVVATTAADWAVGASSAAVHSKTSRNGDEALGNETLGDEQSEGRIRRLDKDSGKITIEHDDLKNLAMPAMTMVFQASDPGLLDKVK